MDTISKKYFSRLTFCLGFLKMTLCEIQINTSFLPLYYIIIQLNILRNACWFCDKDTLNFSGTVNGKKVVPGGNWNI